jgi:hypothetical protein
LSEDTLRQALTKGQVSVDAQAEDSPELKVPGVKAAVEAAIEVLKLIKRGNWELSTGRDSSVLRSSSGCRHRRNTHATYEEVTGSTCAKLPIDIMYTVVCPPPRTVSASAGSDDTGNGPNQTLHLDSGVYPRKKVLVASTCASVHVLARKYSAMTLS